MLLDSNTLLWLLYRSDKLGPRTKQRLDDADQVYVSVASLWELAIKHASGKLVFAPRKLLDDLTAANIERLSITDRHLLHYERTDLPHKDPFGRMLMTQAHGKGIPLVTSDRYLLASKYETLDCTK